MTYKRALFIVGILLFSALLLGLPQVGQFIFTTATASLDSSDYDRRLQDLEAENLELRAALGQLDELRAEIDAIKSAPADETALLARHPLPSQLEFCSESIPLDRPDVQLRLEEEWSRFLVNRHWLLKWRRRAQDVFPIVEAKLAAAGMPDDLKYVLVIESGLEARATSGAGAAGWWQFIRSTGSRYGLARNRHIDERRDLALSTDAALKYFSDLYEEFQSWPLALSAYNAGERRVREAMQEQGETDFYNLVLPRETEAYWFKAAAAKNFLENPSDFALELPAMNSAIAMCDTLQIDVRRSKLALREIASVSGISYRTFKEINPSLRTTWLPRGIHRIVLPSASVDAVIAEVKGLRLKSRQEGRAPQGVALESVDATADDEVVLDPES